MTAWCARTSFAAGKGGAIDATLRLVLSEKGRALVDAVTERRRREIERIVSEIPADEQVVLVHALGRLAAAAGEVPEQDWTTGWDL